MADGRAQRILDPQPLKLATIEPIDPDEDAKAGLTFFIVLILYGQLLTYGYWVAAGVVEEKASRVVEVVLSTIRPAHLLAGKVIGLGLLGLGNLLLIGVIGLGTAAATGALDVDGTVLSAAGLALAWFVVGYAFYACAFACAGALVSRQEDLQSTMTPLTLMILVSFFLAFGVRSAPDGTLAHVTAFIPMTAPMTMPPRIVTGDVATWEVVASFLVTAAGAALLIPLAARIYSGGVLRTGSALKLRERVAGGARMSTVRARPRRVARRLVLGPGGAAAGRARPSRHDADADRPRRAAAPGGRARSTSTRTSPTSSTTSSTRACATSCWSRTATRGSSRTGSPRRPRPRSTGSCCSTASCRATARRWPITSASAARSTARRRPPIRGT